MAYKAKFLHFKTKQSYNTERNKTSEGSSERKIFDAYLSFIDEGPTICTWGKEYKCELSKTEIESLIDSKGFITIDDIPSIPVAGTTTPKVAGTAAVGTSIKYAREDHVHPAQTSITGNAGTATKLQTARTISLTGDITGSTSFDGYQNVSITATVGNDSHTHSNSTITSLDASKLTGTIDIARLPKGALERLVIVANQAARYKLTTSDVQEGDTVKQEDTGVMYFVVDTSNLANENGYKVYTAGSATSVPWSGVTSKPSTLSGYGISSTDSYLAKPTTFNWTNGTSSGPTGLLTGTNTNVSFPAIPAASKTTSGVITTENQEFSGHKTFNDDLSSFTVKTTNVNPLNEDEDLYIGYNIGTGKIYIGADGDYNFGTGGEYTGNAATATKVKNKLTFTGAVTGSYDGSSALTVNIPEGGEVPIALPNPYPIKFTGAVTTSYDGSNSVTVNIPKTAMTYHAYPYSDTSLGSSTATGITPGVVEYPSSWSSTSSSTFTIYVKANSFNTNTPDAVVIVKGTRQVNFSFTSVNGWLVKQSNILTTGSASNTYRVYAFSYLGGSGSSTRVAVNCCEYIVSNLKL